MARFFNTTGPCNPEDHYFLPPKARLRQSNLERYIVQKLYNQQGDPVGRGGSLWGTWGRSL